MGQGALTTRLSCYLEATRANNDLRIARIAARIHLDHLWSMKTVKIKNPEEGNCGWRNEGLLCRAQRNIKGFLFFFFLLPAAG